MNKENLNEKLKNNLTRLGEPVFKWSKENNRIKKEIIYFDEKSRDLDINIETITMIRKNFISKGINAKIKHHYVPQMLQKKFEIEKQKGTIYVGYKKEYIATKKFNFSKPLSIKNNAAYNFFYQFFGGIIENSVSLEDQKIIKMRNKFKKYCLFDKLVDFTKPNQLEDYFQKIENNMGKVYQKGINKDNQYYLIQFIIFQIYRTPKNIIKIKELFLNKKIIKQVVKQLKLMFEKIEKEHKELLNEIENIEGEFSNNFIFLPLMIYGCYFFKILYKRYGRLLILNSKEELILSDNPVYFIWNENENDCFMYMPLSKKQGVIIDYTKKGEIEEYNLSKKETAKLNYLTIMNSLDYIYSSSKEFKIKKIKDHKFSLKSILKKL